MLDAEQSLFAAIIRAAGSPHRARSAGVCCETCGSDSWVRCDDSFDHAFGTHRIEPYLECNVCGETAPMPRE